MLGRRIGHIRIDSLIGEGGMGEVYQGFDESLQRRVALKTIRGHHRFDQAARGRFIREARLLSKLDHPGICHIYDLVEQDDCDFLILEFIDGRMLTSLIQEPITNLDDRLAIAEDIARVLAVAHSSAIAHRDLKPDNIMITPDGHVKILDFGLSRSIVTGEQVSLPPASPTPPASDTDLVPPHDSAATITLKPSSDSGGSDSSGASDHATMGLTQVGSIVGTVRYMSPEQARGEVVSEATDLYSFGIILHELVTGSSPYPDDANVKQLIIAVQKGKAAPARGIDGELAGLIDGLKDLDPSKRPSADAAATRIAAFRDRPRQRRQRRRRIIASLAAAVFITLAVAATWFVARTPRTLSAKPEGRIAILPFVDRTGNQPWVATGLRDLVAKPLGTLPAAVLVSLEQTEDALKTFAIDPAKDLEANQVAALQKVLGAGPVVQTWVERSEDQFMLFYRITLQNAHVDRVIKASSLPMLGDRLATLLAEELHLGTLQHTSRDTFASQAYGIGVYLLRTQGAKVARPLFEAGLVLDPDYHWARLRLAQCEEQLGDWKKGTETARSVLLAAETANDLTLAGSALSYLGSIASARGDYAVAKENLEKALAIHVKRGDGAGQGLVLFQMARMAYTQGKYADARILFTRALELERKTGDHPGEADAVNYLGLVALDTREYAEAEKLFLEAKAISEGYGARRRRAHAIINLGNLADRRQNLADAEKLWQEALTELRACGDRRNELAVLNNLGVLHLKREAFDQARTTFEELVQASAALGDRVTQAVATLNLAQAFLAKKQLTEAKANLDKVMAMETFVRNDPECFSTRAELAYKQGNGAEAVKLMEEAKKLSGKEWSKESQELLDRYHRARVSNKS